MKDLFKYIALALLFTGLFSCEDLFEPIDDNRLTPDFVESDPESAEGILLHAYAGLISHTNFTVAATDDAVSNNLNDAYKRMATGQLSAQYNPAQRWDKYNEIFYINKFIELVESDKVRWNENDTVNLLFTERLMGEALALRAIYHFYILQAHAGMVSGQLLGIPYYEEYLTIEDDFNLPRLSFEETITKITADLDSAIALLPMDYSNKPGDVLPKHQGYDFGQYKMVNGTQFKQRISGLVAQAVKARVELFAASPSYLNGAGYYEKAANTAAEIINYNDGISGLSRSIDFYTSDSKLKGDEFIWRSTIEDRTGSFFLEEQNYPPSVNGSGDINPSHNLVSKFPMENGYPATEANGYDPQNPYENRDPRLNTYILCNNNPIYEDANVITGVGGGIDRIDSIAERSTRTGYYLKKLMRTDGLRILDDGTVTTKKHINIYFRYTELYLILAEAANEIGGPDYAVEGISARDIIAAIRDRAGISQPDDYLASITSKEDMRALIQNERRLELCFEGHRFWDLRRWGLLLNESVSGYFHDGTGYVDIPVVETRDYPEYAIYMPIPNNEIIKFTELEQNQGW